MNPSSGPVPLGLSQVRDLLSDRDAFARYMAALRLADLPRAHHNVVSLAEQGLTLDLLGQLLPWIKRLLAASADTDMALNNLEQFVRGSRSPLSRGAALVRDPRGLGILLTLFGTSQYFADTLCRSPDYFDWLRTLPTTRRPADPQRLHDELANWVHAVTDPVHQQNAIRRFHRREMLRIGYNDLIGDQPLEIVTADISHLAEVCLQVGLGCARSRLEDRHGLAQSSDGPARFTAIALGKLGGEELNYSSDIDLVFLYSADGRTDGANPVSNHEFFSRLVTDTVAMLDQFTEEGQAYRVDLRLRPDGSRGAPARTLDSAVRYYMDTDRVWERQVLIKARPVAGDRDLGGRFIRRIQPFVYRKYLTFEQIGEMKALKRRVETRTDHTGQSEREVKTGRGGIRDVEFVVQFLQLLNGGQIPQLRHPNTLVVLDRLARTRCLRREEAELLADSYRFLRKLEHRLQILFNLQTHRLPDDPHEMSKLATRMGYRDGPDSHAQDQFEAEHRRLTAANRRVLDRLFHEAFDEDDGATHPEVDLILDPAPHQDTIRAVLGRYRFTDPIAAYQHLNELGTETGLFLSKTRCRHFLAGIAPQLLRRLDETPDPDMALVNLEKVTASLGAKGILYELFSRNPSTLNLYVDLCATSEFLSQILVNNPGMIDVVIDSLARSHKKDLPELEAELADLCRGAQDAAPILASYKDQELLRIGVRDIVHKDTIVETTRALSDLAEAILRQITTRVWTALRDKLGEPRIARGADGRVTCQFVVLALGKLGARELAYHSDLDLLFVYEAEGTTAQGTTHTEFFTQLAQGIIRLGGELTPYGRLYEIDVRLRPTGRSGSLVTSVAGARRYYLGPGSQAQLWERLALTRCRPVAGDAAFGQAVMRLIHEAMFCRDWQPDLADELLRMRQRLETSVKDRRRDLKRGFGGIVDIEFLVQMFQVKYGHLADALRTPNILEALDALHRCGLLDEDDRQDLRRAYLFLTAAQNRMRIVHDRTYTELPDDLDDLDKLARRLDYGRRDGRTPGDQLLADCRQRVEQLRHTFVRLVERERNRPARLGGES